MGNNVNRVNEWPDRKVTVRVADQARFADRAFEGLFTDEPLAKSITVIAHVQNNRGGWFPYALAANRDDIDYARSLGWDIDEEHIEQSFTNAGY